MSAGVPRRKGRTVTTGVAIAVLALVVLFVCLCCCGVGAALAVRWLSEVPNVPQEASPSLSDFVPEEELDAILLQRILNTSTTNTDYWRLYGQLKSGTGEPATREAVREPSEYGVGDVHTFWMGDQERQRYWQIDAELRIKTDHAYLYVDQETSLDQGKLREAAQLFESQIYRTNRRVFGSERLPGIDNDPRMTILVTNQMPLGIAGYFSTTDEYPQEMMPHSNEREMIYLTSSYLLDLRQFGQLLSHEFQHMIHWNQDQSEASWVNEGLSLLAEEINGYESVLGSGPFWRDTDMQVTNWSEDSSDRLRNYAASKLLLSYLAEHYGGYASLADLAADDAYGIDGINNLLANQGYGLDFQDVFADWVVANLIDDQDVGSGRYAYALRGASQPRFCTSLVGDAEYAGWVSQFGADYVEVQSPAGTRVSFEGSESVRLAGVDPHGGQFAWWSNRRNMLSSSLTREVNLRTVDAATLRFWTWYDVEEHFDYGYVAASIDGGRTWTTLPGTHTTLEDPNKSNYGHGYTGKSEGWLQESVDLRPYAGQRILLRFWYITDPGLNQPGWLVDDISISEIGFSDGGEREDSGWEVDGFVRSSNRVPQRYVVQLVEYGPAITVRRLGLDENRASVALSKGTRRAVLIVSGATRWTSASAAYRVEVQ
jgi:immune inhibitor A